MSKPTAPDPSSEMCQNCGGILDDLMGYGACDCRSSAPDPPAPRPDQEAAIRERLTEDSVRDIYARIVTILQAPLPPAERQAKVDVYRDAILDAIRPALTPASGWQPISTAPKDGTELLLLTESGRVDIGRFVRGADVWRYRRSHSVRADTWRPPVHWQPLPPAPEDTP